MTVSVLRPRKSNFTRPAFSTSSLSNWVTMLARRRPRKHGHVLPQRLIADHDAGGVHAGVAVQALERLREVEQLAVAAGSRRRAALSSRLLLDRLARSAAHLPWTGSGTSFATLSASANGIVHRARDVADHAERALIWCIVTIWPTLSLPYFSGDVLDDLVAPVHAEVDVEVRHADALGVQEALEQQLVLDRIDVGDAHRVRDQRAGARAAARADRDAVLLGVADEVPDDQEVARELHLLDDAELERAAAPR